MLYNVESLENDFRNMRKENFFMVIQKKMKRLLKKGKRYVKSLFSGDEGKAKILKADGTPSGKTAEYVVKNGEWVKAGAAKAEDNYVRLQGREVGDTGIARRESLAAKTRQKEAFLEERLLSGNYTEGKFLVVLNPYLLSPLSALVLFQTETPYRIKAEVKGKIQDEAIGSTDVSGMTELSTKHRVPVLGLYADEKNEVRLHFIDEKGKTCKIVPFFIETDALPDALQDMVKIKKHETVSALGLTFVYGGDTRFPYAFDRSGAVRFFIERQPKPYGLHFLSNGHFLFAEKNILMPSFSNPHSSQVLEMDMLGRVHRIYNVENGLHHDAGEMTPGGNLIAAGSTLEHSNEDMVMELDRKTGKVVKQVKLAEIFDKTYQDGIDWVHLNTVSYDEKTDSVLICCRNIHTVARIDWKTGKLKWMLCNPKFWEGTSMEDKLLKPVGKGLKKNGWFYQAHAAYMLNEDLDGNPDTVHMMIYDNHWHKRRSVSFFDNNPNSFVRIYTINEKEGTVALWKSYPCAKSKIRSNGILCRDLNRLFAMSGFLEPPVEGCTGMVNEYDFESGELLNQFLTRASYYRAYELPLNYPDLSKKVETDEDYMLGTIRTPYRTEKKDVSGSIPLPKKESSADSEDLYFKGTKAERKKKYQEALAKDQAPFDSHQDAANTEMLLIENILYVKAVDHLIQKIYFVGEKETYVQDYSDTEQTNPSLFGRMFYAVMVPLGGLAQDRYRIYFECGGKLFDTEQAVEMK
jgi:hypothetical protein